MNNVIALKNRTILEISGIDRKNFLQGLITNDIFKASSTQLIYAAMLNATGRFLYDFFIFEDGEKLLLDCHSSRRDEILKKLNFYKLKSQVKLEKNDEIKIYFSFSNNKNHQNQQENFSLQEKKLLKNFYFVDPRCENFGNRIYAANLDESSLEANDSKYHFQRILQKISEGEQDLTYEKSIIAEFNFDNLNAVDYKKGCYIGQELTARTHHMGQVRKQIFHIKINHQVEKGDEISCEGNIVGVVLSSVFYENAFHALALVKISENGNDHKNLLTTNGNEIIIVS